MKISNDVLKIGTSRVNINGDRIEPEAQGARRILSTQVDATNGLNGGLKAGELPAEIEYRSTAGEFARDMRNACGNCKHFNNERFQKMRSYCDSPLASLDEKTLVTEIVGKITEYNNADHDPGSKRFVEEVLTHDVAVCEALSDSKDITFVMREGGCPDRVRSASQPQGFFKPKSRDHEKAGARVYDKVLRLAQGNK